MDGDGESSVKPRRIFNFFIPKTCEERGRVANMQIRHISWCWCQQFHVFLTWKAAHTLYLIVIIIIIIRSTPPHQSIKIRELMEDSSSSSQSVVFDAIVVGAGIMGSSAAYHLTRRSPKVLLLEQFDFLHHRGSSHGESRTIRATYPEDYYCDMVVESARLWEEAQEEIGYKVYFKAQHLDMGPSDSKSLLSVISSCQKKGVPLRVLDRAQVAEEFSGKIDLPENWVAVSTGLGGVIKPTKAVSMYQTLSFQRGAILRDSVEVKNIVRNEDGMICVIGANGEKFIGRKCVITAGAWMRNLVKNVSGLDLPIQALETTVCYWRVKEAHQDHFSIAGGFPTFASYGNPYVYGTPSLEFPGLIKAAVHGGYQCDPDKRPWGPGLPLGSLKEWLEGRLSGLVDSAGPVATQLCLYSMTPDEDFVIDFLGGEFGKDVVIAGGFSGHGFKMAPVVGRILADLVLSGEAKGVELQHFRIQRFQENPKGNAKEYGDQVSSCLND